MFVFVVMANDIVDCVFDDKERAVDYVTKRKLEDNPDNDGYFHRIFWRYYKHELNKEGHPR